MNLQDQEFNFLSKMLYEAVGINLTSEKKALVTGRLAKRVRTLNLNSYGEYFQLLATGSRQGGEWQTALDLLTTNETSFFREPQHFEFLGGTILSALPPGQSFRVWSAACSSGEEPYSLAMVLADRRGDAWELVASDISQRVLDQARRGVYSMERASQIPGYYLKRYFLKGTGEQHGSIMVDAPLKSHMQFMQVNLVGALPALGQFDLIVLRNVMIYFDAPTKRAVIASLVKHLKPGGWFFSGHSESITGMHPELHPVKSAVYQKVV